jgi:hypothetical protein
MRSHNPLQKLMQGPRVGTDTRRKRLIDDEWQTFRTEAARWLADLDKKYDSLAEETRQSIDQVRRAQAKPLGRRGFRRFWLPIATGLSVFAAVVVAIRSM